MKKTALVLIVLTILTKTIGFAREITLSYFYGASPVSDAFLISITIPIVIFTFVGTAIATSYIPMYSSIERESGTESANKFTSGIINFAMIFCTLLIVIILVFTVPIVRLFASGFEGETLSLTVSFTRISIIAIYFSAISYIFIGYLQLRKIFVVPALITIPFNLIMMISIGLSVRFGIFILPFGVVIAVSSQLLLLIPFVRKQGYRHTFRIDLANENYRKMLYLSLPIILGTSVNQINMLIDRTIASNIAVGGISALTYASRLNLFIHGIFVISIATALYPTISKMAAERNLSGLKESISEAISGINLLVIPAIVGAMVFAEPIVKLLFGRGAFKSEALVMTTNTFFFYSIGIVGFGLREILSRSFFSLHDTKTPIINASIAIVMNIILNVVLSRFLGIGGLALATSISAIFAAILMFISLRKKIGSFGLKKITISFLKILCASLLMGLLAKLSFNYLTSTISQNFSLLIATGIGAATYISIIYFMKIDDVVIIVNAIKRKMKKCSA